MKIKNSLQVAIFTLFVVWPAQVFAAQTLGAVGQNVGENLKQASAALKYGAMVIGLFLVIWGLKNFVDAQKGHGQVSAGLAIVKIVVGVCLLGIGGVAAMGSATLFGADQATGIQELGI